MSKTYIPVALRERVIAQSRHRCGFCLTQEAVVGIPLEIDHIIPESLGGLTEEDNLWSVCAPCNGHKADRIAAIDPQSRGLTFLFDPRHQVWREHFMWSADGELIIGLTPTGRATVEAVQLNRPTLVVARKLWVSVGWHPPEDFRE